MSFSNPQHVIFFLNFLSYSFILILVLFIRLVIETLFFEILISDDVVKMVFIIMSNSRLVVKESAASTFGDKSNVSNNGLGSMTVKKFNEINAL